MSTPLRREVITIYKELISLTRAYPLGARYAHQKLHAAFSANAHLRDEKEIRTCIERAEFVRKEIEALYYLKRYRTLRGRYNSSG